MHGATAWILGRYPHGGGGEGRSPGGFRAFASLDYGATLPDLLKSFEVIYRIDVVGRHLILTRARYDHTRPFPPFRPLHSHLDIYDRHTGLRIYEDIPLPEGSKVLGGGWYLYLLLNQDFPPWRIAKLRLRR